MDEVDEKLKVLEEGIGSIFPEGRIPMNNGGDLGLLDLVIFSALGVKLLDPEKIPLVHSWIGALNDLPIVKQTIPPHDKMVISFKNIRQRMLTIPIS